MGAEPKLPPEGGIGEGGAFGRDRIVTVAPWVFALGMAAALAVAAAVGLLLGRAF